ncbi:hypothetical protein J4444_01655 [Candidatus Woesearchaeota archaeon]|nr:hypothetical protein [Candidatus Woesearchaeota archaeon]
MPHKKFISVLPHYANPANLKQVTYEREHESKISLNDEGVNLELSKFNSLTEEKYSLNLKSAKYLLEGTNEIKEAMIHHHPRGHSGRHLQFKLLHKHEVIRIILDPMDDDDYKECIKGFLFISQEILLHAQTKVDVISYFFNPKIQELEKSKIYLLGKVKRAYKNGEILDTSDKVVDAKKLVVLRNEKHLLPFLNWD